MEALVVGGTGPTGPHIVKGLLARGFRVSILHTGSHESEEIPPEVEHIHTDPSSRDAVEKALGGRRFDLAVVTYGRLRELASLLVGRVGRLLSVGGTPVYQGFANSDAVWPEGLPVPTREDAPLVGPDEHPYLRKIRETEEILFELHPEATHFRYPLVYGPRQHVPREWLVVRRILDGRPHIILPDGGLSLRSCGFAENIAHAVLLGVDAPGVAAGKTYNVGDEQTATLRQFVEIIRRALDSDLEIIQMPAELAISARPLMMNTVTDHLVTDIGAIRQDLGYRDRVPMSEAIARTARWLAEHPEERGGRVERSMQDPFDYAAEDRIVEAWHNARASALAVVAAVDPGYRAQFARNSKRRTPRLGTRVP